MFKELKLTAETVDGGMFVLAVDGEIDLFTAPAFERELLPGVENGATGVLIDLTDCRFIDATALGVLLRARRRLNGARGIAIVAADPHVRKVFEVTGLDRIFAIHPTRAAALAEASGDLVGVRTREPPSAPSSNQRAHRRDRPAVCEAARSGS